MYYPLLLLLRPGLVRRAVLCVSVGMFWYCERASSYFYVVVVFLFILRNYHGYGWFQREIFITLFCCFVCIHGYIYIFVVHFIFARFAVAVFRCVLVRCTAESTHLAIVETDDDLM